ncbi:MAG: energy-coupling factor transporter transmembrane component T family protein [Candidatus Asgardarchaeia archaeon]
MAFAFKYIRGESVIHKLDVRTKLGMVLLHTAAAIVIWDIRMLAILLVLGFLWLFLAKIDWHEIKKPFTALLVLLILVTILTNMFYPTIATKTPHILFSWGPIVIAYESIIYSLTVTCRYLSIFPLATLFILTTDPSKLTIALSKLKVPYKLAFSVNIALRYLPTLIVDYQIITNAQKARGFELEKLTGGFISKVKRTAPIMVPMLLLSIKRAEQVADAMDLRAFGAYKKRTWLYDVKMKYSDYAMLLFYFAVLISYVYLRMFILTTLWIPPYSELQHFLNWVPL